MIHLQNMKFVSITPPGAIVDNDVYVTAEIDTIGFDYLVVVAYLGATDIAMAALKMTSSDTAGSGHADVTGLISGTSLNIDGAASVLPSDADDGTFQVFEINLKQNRKRYWDLVATAGNGAAGTYLTAFAILGRAEEAPVTMAQKGANEVLRI